MILVGNKTDIRAERAVPIQDGQKLAQKWDCSLLKHLQN